MTHSVLIIEDDPSMLRGLRDNFSMRGYRVTTASDGAQGLAAAMHEQPDLILLDIMLPKVHGYEVCQRLRKLGLNTPIIMLTAKTQESDIVLGLELGADDYVTKPFSIRELMARARALLRRPPITETAATINSFGPFQLDSSAHLLTRGSETVPLTTKEYELLRFFLSNSGRALTRREIVSKVWGSSLAVTGRSVDRCVTTLRAKIEVDSQHPQFIHTVRDVGYRFVANADEESSAD